MPVTLRRCLIAGLLLCACSKRTPTEDPPAPVAPAPPAVESVSQRTTPGEVALQNLDAQIRSLGQRVEAHPQLLEARRQLVELLLTRAQFTGSFDDFTRSLELAEAAVKAAPQAAGAWLLRARAKSAVHRFAEAAADVERARALGSSAAAPLRAGIQIARGEDLPAALDIAKAEVARHPSFQALVLQAAAEAALGRFDAADEHYRAALQGYRDISPFPVAFVLFQRGVMWAEMADAAERARPLYEEAVRRLPQYVVANVHLAELEAEAGDMAAAISRLRPLAARTRDPEPSALLAELLLVTPGRAPEARRLLERARTGYDELLARHRAAFLDHASEFFAGPGGDATLALALARENLELRNTPRAHELVVGAALADGDLALACEQLERARPLRERSRNLAALSQRERRRCPPPAGSRALP